MTWRKSSLTMFHLLIGSCFGLNPKLLIEVEVVEEEESDLLSIEFSIIFNNYI